MAEKRTARWRDQSLIKHYQIDRKGNVTCILGLDVLYRRKLSPGKTPKYYWHVLLRLFGRDRWIAVHRLMAYTWLGSFPHPLRRICDHIDSNSENNNSWNLRYLTIRGNNLNRAGVSGVVQKEGIWYPRIAGYIHHKYGNKCHNLVKEMRHTLLQSYIRYTMRFPENCDYPHEKIYCF